MKEIYKRAMNKMTPSQSAKDKAKALYDSSAITAESTDNITQLKPKKKSHAYKGVIAAGLAVALTLGAVFGSGMLTTGNTDGTQPQYGFIITANAAEIANGQSASISLDDSTMCINEDADKRTKDSQVFSYYINFPLTCEGNNIDTITYSINKGGFRYFCAENNIVVDGTELENRIEAPGWSPKEYKPTFGAFYSSFTVKYDNQTSDDVVLDIVGEEEIGDGTTNDKNRVGKSCCDPYALENQILNDMKINVTVKFTDGSTQTQTVVLHCERKDNPDGEWGGVGPYIVFSLESENYAPATHDNFNEVFYSNDFFLLVYGEEITNGKAEEITQSKSSSILLDESTMDYSGGGDESETHFAYNIILPFQCLGANIDTITYSINKGAFQCSYLGSSPVIAGTELESPLNVGFHSPKGDEKTIGTTPDFKQYSSFTLNGEKQLSDYFTFDIVGTAELSKEEFDIMFGDSVDIHKQLEVTNKLLKDTVIDITVKFNNGTTKSEKILIGCEEKASSDGTNSDTMPVITFSLAPSET